MSSDRNWMRMNRASNEWLKGFEELMELKFKGAFKGATSPCPCRRCRCMSYKTRPEIERDLLFRGFDESFIQENDHEDYEKDDVTEGVGDEGSANNAKRSLFESTKSNGPASLISSQQLRITARNHDGGRLIRREGFDWSTWSYAIHDQEKLVSNVEQAIHKSPRIVLTIFREMLVMNFKVFIVKFL